MLLFLNISGVKWTLVFDHSEKIIQRSEMEKFSQMKQISNSGNSGKLQMLKASKLFWTTFESSEKVLKNFKWLFLRIFVQNLIRVFTDTTEANVLGSHHTESSAPKKIYYFMSTKGNYLYIIFVVWLYC